MRHQVLREGASLPDRIASLRFVSRLPARNDWCHCCGQDIAMNKPVRIALALFAAVALTITVALVLLMNFDWNRAKPWLNNRLSEALDRPFLIKGNLSLSWEKPPSAAEGWHGLIPWPHLLAEDIHIGNPAQMAAEIAAPALPLEMASIGRLAFSVNPWALLGKQITIPVLQFDTPHVNLLRAADGKNNWTFQQEGKPSPWRINIQDVVLATGSLRAVDAIRHADVTASINTMDNDPHYGIKWQLQGKVNGEDITGSGRAGAVLALQRQAAPYPIQAELHMGKTLIALTGTYVRQEETPSFDMHLQLSGQSMDKLYALSGITLPQTPRFSTRGHLLGTLGEHDKHWLYENFVGRVGGSDIGGTLAYQLKAPRPQLSGAVLSHLLKFSDLAPLIGADTQASKAARGEAFRQPAGRLLPHEPFKSERWTSIDADVKYRAEKILRNKKLPINNLSTTLHLKDGVLSLLPLNFGVAGGELNADIVLNGSGKPAAAIQSRMQAAARHLQLNQIFPTVRPLQNSAGEINGNAALSATGNSVASLLGTSNGEIKIYIRQGTFSKLMLEEMGVNIGNIILTKLTGDKQIKLNCLSGDFTVSNGVMHTRSFIADTDAAILHASGDINLAEEQLDLTLQPNSKNLRLLSLRTPLYIRGSFVQPKVSINKGVMALKVGGAAALAAIAPVAALIPLTKSGENDDSDCGKLLLESRAMPKPPAPGKSHRPRRKK